MMTPGLDPPECSAATADGRDPAPAVEDECGAGDIVVRLPGDFGVDTGGDSVDVSFGHWSTVRSCKTHPVIVWAITNKGTMVCAQ